MTIEPLELRIAPATLVNPTTVTYTDVDGDLVTVKISKGAFQDPAHPLFGTDDFTFMNIGVGEQLQIVNLSDDGSDFQGANLTITAVRGPMGGDGRANVGHLNSAGRDLGVVTV